MSEYKTFEMFPTHPRVSHEVLRTIRYVPFGFGDFGEVFQICRRIDLKDEDSWYEAWNGHADYCMEIADKAYNEGCKITACKKYKDAVSYYRNAEFYLAPFDPRRDVNYDKLSYCFERVVETDDLKAELVKIPYGESFMYGVFVPAEPQNGKPAPCVACIGGLDSLKEEMYCMAGRAWSRRGVSVLAVDGPGQGATLRKNKIISRYDYEVPGKAIADYMQSRPDVDPERIGMSGLSLGGYYIARVAAFESRFSAFIALSGQYDYGKTWQKRPDDHDVAPFLVWITGSKDIKEAKEKVKTFALSPEILSKVRAPFLIAHGIYDPLIPMSEAEKQYAELVNSKNRKLIAYDETTGGVLHCQDDYTEGVISDAGDWLVEVYGLEVR